MADRTPLENFKQVLTGAARALAHEPEVEVAWSADSPAQAGKNFRVPLPGRNLPPDQATEDGSAAGRATDVWGNLPIHLQDIFRAEGGGDLPAQYRDWIDAYYRRLNDRARD